MKFCDPNPPIQSKKPLRKVISTLLIYQQKILILKRSRRVGSFQGYWSCISGYLERNEDPLKTAMREVTEETQKDLTSLSLVNRAGPFYSETEEIIFESFWFCFDCEDQIISLDWEHDEFEWIDPRDDQYLKNKKVVPWLEKMVQCLIFTN